MLVLFWSFDSNTSHTGRDAPLIHDLSPTHSHPGVLHNTWRVPSTAPQHNSNTTVLLLKPSESVLVRLSESVGVSGSVCGVVITSVPDNAVHTNIQFYRFVFCECVDLR